MGLVSRGNGAFKNVDIRVTRHSLEEWGGVSGHVYPWLPFESRSPSLNRIALESFRSFFFEISKLCKSDGISSKNDFSLDCKIMIFSQDLGAGRF